MVRHSATPTFRRQGEHLVRRNGISRITSYFPVRKRNTDDDFITVNKQLRGGVITCDTIVSPIVDFHRGTKPSHPVCLIIANEHQTENIRSRSRSKHAGSTVGVFRNFPALLYLSVFDSIEVNCLCSLCMTSSAVNSYLLKYIDSSLFLHRVKRESNVFSLTEGDSKEKFFTELDPFSCYGKFLKAATICFPTVKRVSILTSFCMRAVEHGIDRSGIGRAIHTMCSKWAFSECAKVLETILAANGGRLQNSFEEIEKNAPGSLPDLEIELRSFILPLFLSGRDASYEGGDIEYAFWLSAVMRCLRSPSAQSKLLMILFGPVSSDPNEAKINWRFFCEEIVLTSEDARSLLKPLSDALHTLMKTKQHEEIPDSWSQREVFNMIEELSTTPEPWAFENFVSMLLFRPSLIPISLTARMENNYIDEACMMFNTFAVVAQRWNIDICRVIQLPVMQAMRAVTRERGRAFYDQICELYARQLKMVSQRGRAGAEDLSILLESHAAVRPLLLLMSESLW